MQIFINNEEVLCSSSMTIQKQLSNTSSVILNNVYPRSWENDKDYVSRFYMPEDYSKCKIIDENIITSSTYNLTNNVLNLNDRYVGGTSLKIIPATVTVNSIYVKLIPNKSYTINITNNASGSMSVFETDSLNLYTQTTALLSIEGNTSGTYTITPTKKYIIATNKWNNNDYIDINSITINTMDNLIFSGIVKNSGKIELNPRYPHYATLQILDFETFLSDGDTLNYVLEEQTITNAIKRIVKDLDGFMVGEINITNEGTIAPYNCNEKTAFDVFEYLAEISGSIWFTKVISDDIVLINFCSIDNLEQASNIEYNEQYFEDNSIQDISYSFNTQDYRNKQVIVNDKSKSGIPQTEYLTYNGTNLRTLYNINSIVSIKSGTRAFTTAPFTAQQNGTYADFYYSGNTIDVNVTIATGTVLEVTYYSTIATRQVAYNQNEIDRISSTTGRNGTIARYEKRTDTNDNTALSQIAQSYLDFKGVPEVILTIKTFNYKLLELGQKVFFNGPLDLLKTTYLVKEKKINMITSGDQETIFYTYVLTSSFNDENAINFFDNQRRKLEGNIEEGQYITRYIDLYSTTNIIFYNLNITEEEQPVNMLDAELDFDI